MTKSAISTNAKSTLKLNVLEENNIRWILTFTPYNAACTNEVIMMGNLALTTAIVTDTFSIEDDSNRIWNKEHKSTRPQPPPVPPPVLPGQTSRSPSSPPHPTETLETSGKHKQSTKTPVSLVETHDTNSQTIQPQKEQQDRPNPITPVTPVIPVETAYAKEKEEAVPWPSVKRKGATRTSACLEKKNYALLGEQENPTCQAESNNTGHLSLRKKSVTHRLQLCND